MTRTDRAHSSVTVQGLPGSVPESGPDRDSQARVNPDTDDAATEPKRLPKGRNRLPWRDD
jgi:hypothetical protein